jgi:nucleolar protein 15
MSEALANKTKRGYMYIGHIPHGFYEKEMKGYFSQFGKVKRIRLARSKATGKYKGYGFLEFESESVAKIAADTMNNYLMFNKILKCHLIPKEKLHENAFKNSHKLFSVPLKSLFRRKYNKLKSTKQIEVAKGFA